MTNIDNVFNAEELNKIANEKFTKLLEDAKTDQKFNDFLELQIFEIKILANTRAKYGFHYLIFSIPKIEILKITPNIEIFYYVLKSKLDDFYVSLADSQDFLMELDLYDSLNFNNLNVKIDWNV